MILKGAQRGGARQMALHLLNGEQNEHVNVHQVRGFLADDVLGALNEIYAVSKGTNCRKFMYSLSLSPPPEESVPHSVFEEALARIEKKLGLENQPRVIVFHEKEGRRHAHSVWSRIDVEAMIAIPISHDKLKLRDCAKALFLEHGWKMPDGFRDKSKKSVLNFSRAEWQQAARIGRKASDIKRELQDCWAVSDDKKSFENVLRETGYFLARGDKRSYVVIDQFGEIYSLPRQLGLKAKDLKQRLGDFEKLLSVNETKEIIATQLSPLFKKYRDELADHHASQRETLLQEKRSMTLQHRKTRADLKAFQDKRWREEENRRAARVRHGFKGLWDKLSGRYWAIRKENEKDAYECYLRDQKQKEGLIEKQLSQRQTLQNHITRLHETQEEERKTLLRDLSHIASAEQIKDIEKGFAKEQNHDNERGYDGPEMEM